MVVSITFTIRYFSLCSFAEMEIIQEPLKKLDIHHPRIGAAIGMRLYLFRNSKQIKLLKPFLCK